MNNKSLSTIDVDNILFNLISVDNLSYDDSKYIFNYYLNNRNNISFKKRYVNTNQECAYVLSLFSDNVIIRILYDFELNKEVLLYLIPLCSSIESFLLLNKSLYDKYNLSINDFKRLFQSCKNIDQSLFDSSYLVQMIVEINNPILYMQLIMILEDKIDLTNIRRLREIYLLKHIRDLNASKMDLLQYISNYFFEDYYENVVINIKEMLNYLDFKNSNLEFYKSFINLSNLNESDILAFFDKHALTGNKISLFYDDIRKVKDVAYQDLVNKAFKLESQYYNNLMSKKYGIDIYMLDGEDFSAFIRCLNLEKEKYQLSSDNYVYSSLDYGYCFSYIGSENINTIRDPKEYITFLYSDVDYRRIIWLNHEDLFSIAFNNSKYLSFKVNEIHNRKSLMANTAYYNEIIIKNDDGIVPTAFLCYDKVTDIDILIANKYQLPIVLVNSSKYKIKEEVAYNSKIYTL